MYNKLHIDQLLNDYYHLELYFPTCIQKKKKCLGYVSQIHYNTHFFYRYLINRCTILKFSFLIDLKAKYVFL